MSGATPLVDDIPEYVFFDSHNVFAVHV